MNVGCLSGAPAKPHSAAEAYIYAGLPEFFKIVTQLWINLWPTLSYTFESDSEDKWPIFFSSLELALSNRDAGAAADAIRESLDKGLRIYLSLLTRVR
jgi:GntR family colanic acid and biofilm gene transcriptional regulator